MIIIWQWLIIKPNVNNCGSVCWGSDVDLEGGPVQSVPFQADQNQGGFIQHVHLMIHEYDRMVIIIIGLDDESVITSE